MAGDPDETEWLEADGQGGFASGTASGIRTRRYQALLLAATSPPTGRMVLVNGIEAWLEIEGATVALTSQRYAPGLVHPDGARRIAAFTTEPWPRWSFAIPGGGPLEHEILVAPPTRETVLTWSRPQGGGRLHVRPLLSGRDYHALHHENPAFRFEPVTMGEGGGCSVTWSPYPGVPSITALTNGVYAQAPEWYRSFLYTAERERGLDDVEDLASPGVFSFDLGSGPAYLVLRAGDDLALPSEGRLPSHASGLVAMAGERARRAALPSRLARSAAAYRVARGGGRTIVAGYPWFTDWGRDTFIAMRGLAIATGALDEAEAILGAWSEHVDGGMLPNRFPDSGEAAEYNSVDAALWFVIAAHDLLAATAAAGRPTAAIEGKLASACQAVLSGYAGGTRYGIAADPDGLLKAGEPGSQLTWMDARVDGAPITPRVGKPVEVQALWINALAIASRWSDRWGELEARARTSFAARFPTPSGGLHDVVDVDHVAGQVDAAIRPNQILAVGGLPFPVLTGAPARTVVDLVEARLLTPLGLRTLAPDDPAYRGRYAGGPAERDGAYHQGTAWPWLMGPFVDAWLAVRGRSPQAVAEARTRFLPPLLAHLDEAGLGHVAEVVDGDAPHRPGGCPFQAWSTGEIIRILDLLHVARP